MYREADSLRGQTGGESCQNQKGQGPSLLPISVTQYHWGEKHVRVFIRELKLLWLCERKKHNSKIINSIRGACKLTCE